MIREFIRMVIDIFKAIFRFKSSVSQQNQQQDEQHLQEHQQHLQEQYNKIDEQHQVKPNPTLQEVQDKLNDRF